MSLSKFQYIVKMNCESCVTTVERSLENVPGIESYDVSLITGIVTVETTKTSDEVLAILRTTGKRVQLAVDGIVGGIAIINSSTDFKGAVRFLQEPMVCVVEGKFTGLEMSIFRMTVHESGDTSQGCDGVGEVFNLPQYGPDENAYGDLGIFLGEKDNCASFSFHDTELQLHHIIGRAIVIKDEKSGEKLGCGVIARAPGIPLNPRPGCNCTDSD